MEDPKWQEYSPITNQGDLKHEEHVHVPYNFDSGPVERIPSRKVRRHMWHLIPHNDRPSFEEYERKQMWRPKEGESN